MVLKKKYHQITIRKMGKKYLVCVSGTPRRMCSKKCSAESFANKLRVSQGKRPKREKK